MRYLILILVIGRKLLLEKYGKDNTNSFIWHNLQENPGIIFIAMNYSVHAAMYTYYWLAIIKKVRKGENIELVVVSQRGLAS